MPRFTKIKYRTKKGEHAVDLRWEEEQAEGKTAITHHLTSTEAPWASLPSAMTAFVPPVLRLLELDADYEDGLEVVGLSISYGDDGRRGLVVTCLKELSSSPAPLVLNTPHLQEAGDDDAPALPAEMERALDNALAAATLFLEGSRAQGSLFEALKDDVQAIQESLGDGESVTISSPGSKPVTLHGTGKRRS